MPSAEHFPVLSLTERVKSSQGADAAKPAEVTYAEGIYAGYRYYDAFGVALFILLALVSLTHIRSRPCAEDEHFKGCFVCH